MNTVTILARTDPKIKYEAQKTAKELGLSLSAVINRLLQEFVKTKSITFGQEYEEPTPYLKNILRKAEKNLKEGRTSPGFSNAKDAIAYLHEQTK